MASVHTLYCKNWQSLSFCCIIHLLPCCRVLRITFQRGDAPLQQLRLATLSASLAIRTTRILQCDYCDVNSEAKTASAAASQCRLASTEQMLAQQRVWRRLQLAALSAAKQTDSITHRITTQAERAFPVFHFEMTEGYFSVEKQRASILNLVTISANSYSVSQTLHGAKTHHTNSKLQITFACFCPTYMFFFFSKGKTQRCKYKSGGWRSSWLLTHHRVLLYCTAKNIWTTFFEKESMSSISSEILHSPIYPLMLAECTRILIPLSLQMETQIPQI